MKKRYVLLMRPDGSRLVIDSLKTRMHHLRRRVFAWAQTVEPMRAAGTRLTMFTLTYDTEGTRHAPARWSPGDIRDFALRLRWRMGNRLLAYAWVAELQTRGAIHYHVLTLHRGRAPMPDKPYRGKMGIHRNHLFGALWSHGWSHTDFDVHTVFYICTYVGKEYQKNFEKFPPGAHAWGVWVSDRDARVKLRYASLSEGQRRIVDYLGWDELSAVDMQPGFYEDVWEQWRFIGAFGTVSDAEAHP